MNKEKIIQWGLSIIILASIIALTFYMAAFIGEKQFEGMMNASYQYCSQPQVNFTGTWKFHGDLNGEIGCNESLAWFKKESQELEE